MDSWFSLRRSGFDSQYGNTIFQYTYFAGAFLFSGLSKAIFAISHFMLKRSFSFFLGWLFFSPSSWFFWEVQGRNLNWLLYSFRKKTFRHFQISGILKTPYRASFMGCYTWSRAWWYDARPPHPTKHNLQNASNVQGEAHIRIILGKLVTSLATEMCKMTLKPVTLSLPAHPTPTCRNVRLLCVTQSVEWWVHNRSKHNLA